MASFATEGLRRRCWSRTSRHPAEQDQDDQAAHHQGALGLATAAWITAGFEQPEDALTRPTPRRMSNPMDDHVGRGPTGRSQELPPRTPGMPRCA